MSDRYVRGGSPSRGHGGVGVRPGIPTLAPARRPSRILAFALCLALGGLIGVGAAGLTMAGALTWADLPYIGAGVVGIALLFVAMVLIGMVAHGHELARDAKVIRERGNA